MQFVFLVVGLLTTCSGVHQQPDEDGSPGNEIGIILVISKTAVDSIVRDQVEMNIPIARQVEGIPVTGNATGRGIPRVEFTPSTDTGRFNVVVEGTADGSFSATVGPATVRASTKATFLSQKEIEFDGEEFFALPSTTTNCNLTTIDQICSRPRRLVGRLVRRVAGCIARRNKQDIDQEVVKVTRELIDSTFEEEAEQLADSLDGAFPFAETIHKYFPETENWNFSLSTRSDSIVAGIGPSGAQLPQAFAEGSEGNLLDDPSPALAEIWLRTTPGQAALLQLAADWDIAYDLLQEKFDAEIAKTLLENVKLVNVEGWSILRVGVEQKSEQDSP